MPHNTRLHFRAEFGQARMQQYLDSEKERNRALARLRFPPELESRFRLSLRHRLRLARSIMFLVIALGFGFAPLYSASIMQVREELVPFLNLLSVGFVAPVLLMAAGATFMHLRASIVQPLQFAAAVVAVSATLIIRFMALQGGLQYPAEMTGVMLIAIAFFGGFNWRRVALAALVFTTIGIGLEFWQQTPQTQPLLHAYPLFFMAIIAILGSYVQERITRLNWWDLNRLRSAQTALRESERRFEAFMDHTPAIAWIKDSQSRYQYRNKAHRDRYGQPGEDWTGHTDADYFPQTAVGTYADTDQQVLRTGQQVDFETVNHSRDGSINEWWVQKFPFADDAGNQFVAGIGVDIGERNRLKKQLQESEALFQGFLDNSPTVSWMKDEQGRYLYVSQSYKQFLGVTDDSWSGRTDFDLYPEDFAQKGRDLDLEVLNTGGSSEVEGPAVDCNGVTKHWLLVRFAFTDQTGGRYLGGVATDVTIRKKAEDMVRLQSLTDELTGLYNRRGFSLLADQQLKHAFRHNWNCALLYVDLDGLKQINAEHGHDGGDLAIASVSEAMRVAARASDIVARIGGDEFVVFAPDCEDVQALTKRMINAVEEYNLSEALPFQLSVSIGISEFKANEASSIEHKLSEADMQMLAVKRLRVA